MAILTWDDTGKRLFETGVDRGVLFVMGTSAYNKGVAWNGLTSVTESPSGAEANDQYADNIKYLSLMSAENFGGTIEAFTYPDEFGACDGIISPSIGLNLGQQGRKQFGLAYRTKVGNDVSGQDFGYKIHLIYGCLATPSEKQYSTINDSPEAMTLSWEFTSTGVVTGSYKPVASLTVDSTKVTPAKLKSIEDKLYGTASLESTLPLPSEVITMMAGA